MEFRITRTSIFLDDEKRPCVEAYKKKRGNSEAWFIEINSLEELLKINDKYDDIILQNCGKDRVIEIYDDWRE